jgi:hypothetical protein
VDGYETYFQPIVEMNEAVWINSCHPFELSEEKVVEEQKACEK